MFVVKGKNNIMQGISWLHISGSITNQGSESLCTSGIYVYSRDDPCGRPGVRPRFVVEPISPTSSTESTLYATLYKTEKVLALKEGGEGA